MMLTSGYTPGKRLMLRKAGLACFVLAMVLRLFWNPAASAGHFLIGTLLGLAIALLFGSIVKRSSQPS